jgi:hypothetical protein
MQICLEATRKTNWKSEPSSEQDKNVGRQIQCIELHNNQKHNQQKCRKVRKKKWFMI